MNNCEAALYISYRSSNPYCYLTPKSAGLGIIALVAIKSPKRQKRAKQYPLQFYYHLH